jgi:hypothetical protein
MKRGGRFVVILADLDDALHYGHPFTEGSVSLSKLRDFFHYNPVSLVHYFPDTNETHYIDCEFTADDGGCDESGKPEKLC